VVYCRKGHNNKSGTYQAVIAGKALLALIGTVVGAVSGLGLSLLPIVFIWTGVFERSKWKYMQRAYRYVYLDAGIIGENLALASTGIGLGSCQIGAFFDDEVNAILEVDGAKESVLYLSVVGHPLRI